MKKIVIVGGGTAGLIAASFMNRYWEDNAHITVICDENNKTIGVGESTTPVIQLILQVLGIPISELINIDSTIKIGINFKDWIPGKEFFHGFPETILEDVQWFPVSNDETSAVYSLLNHKYNGASHFNEPVTKLPSSDPGNMGTIALHIDTLKFVQLLRDRLKDTDSVEFIDDVVDRVRVNAECDKITNIELKNNGIIDADFYIDASGFNAVLFKHLNPRWNDISKILPIDRAIPQQVPNTSGGIPSYTQAEATDNGWIWQLPIGNRYGTGYLYSSKFTSDEEAREKYNKWLLKNHNKELETDRIIKYRPGYYEDNLIGNCMAVGLAAGFLEPLESTSIGIMGYQVYNFLVFNGIGNLSYTKRFLNKNNRSIYQEVMRFLTLHYCTNRTDSEFWRYMTNNKTEWVEDFEEKCNKEFIDASVFDTVRSHAYKFDSYVQIANGLNLFNIESLRNFLTEKPEGQAILDSSENLYEQQENIRRQYQWVPHTKVIDLHKYSYGSDTY